MNRFMIFRLSGMVAAAAVALALLRAAPGQTVALLAQPHASVAAHGSTAAAVTVADLAAFLTAAWLGLGAASALVSVAPGAVGRLGAVAARAVLPRAVVGLAAGAAGMGILTAAAGCAQAADAGRPGPATPVVTTARSAASASTLPAPAIPTDPAPVADPPPPPQVTPRAPIAVVTVQPGDSLWRIAGRSLGAQATPARIAVTWPQWFAANRDTIGPDPDYLVPGEVLHAPEPAPAATSTQAPR